jgi:hypothetical protein
MGSLLELDNEWGSVDMIDDFIFAWDIEIEGRYISDMGTSRICEGLFRR